MFQAPVSAGEAARRGISARATSAALQIAQIADREALDRIIPLVWTELHRLARRYLQLRAGEFTEQPGSGCRPFPLDRSARHDRVDRIAARWVRRGDADRNSRRVVSGPAQGPRFKGWRGADP